MNVTTSRVGWAFVGLLMGVLFCALLYVPVLLSQVRETQLEGTPTGKKLVESSDRILDCTDPAGDCYKRNERRTAKVVGDIGRYIVLASACAADVDSSIEVNARIAAIGKCVTERLR